jgi:hypothetical protein
MYFETEYHGGTGGQGAAVYANGATVFGPTWDEFGPINSALALFSVTIVPPAHDAFDAIGLWHYRYTDDWLS